ncbi:hypothetical protein pb186bvf_008146 [Paramecium bursaria]
MIFEINDYYKQYLSYYQMKSMIYIWGYASKKDIPQQCMFKSIVSPQLIYYITNKLISNLSHLFKNLLKQLSKLKILSIIFTKNQIYNRSQVKKKIKQNISFHSTLDPTSFKVKTIHLIGNPFKQNDI